VNVMYDTAKKMAHLVEYLRIYWTDFHHMEALADDGSVPYFSMFPGTLPWQPNNVAKTLSMPTNTTCIRCTSAISWSSYSHYQRR